MKTFKKNHVPVKFFFIAVLYSSLFYFSACEKDPCKNIICQNGGTSYTSGKDCMCNCTNDYEGPNCETKKCTIIGNSVNIGSTSGGTYYHTVDAGKRIGFSNTNLNFSLAGGGYLMSVGPQSCLDFTYSGNPTTTEVAYTKGNGYVGHYLDGKIVKFIAGNYNDGIVNITYDYQ